MAESILKEMTVLPSPYGPLVPTAHPEGCQAAIGQDFVAARELLGDQAVSAQGQHAVIIGGSQGYGAALALSALAAGMDVTLFAAEGSPQFERGRWKSSPGYYNLKAIHEIGAGRVHTLVGNIFSDAHKDALLRAILARGGANLVIYSVAAPRRAYQDGEWQSSLRTIDEPIGFVGIDLKRRNLASGTVSAATPEEIANTVAVMGGADFKMLVSAMVAVGALRPGATVIAPSYVGPLDFDVLRRMYPHGALGKAKDHLHDVIEALDQLLRERLGGRALDIKLPAVVTNASKAIPCVVKYLSCYFAAVAREDGVTIYQDPLAVAAEVFKILFGGNQDWDRPLAEGGRRDEKGRVAFDPYELSPDTQIPLREVWNKNDTPGPMDDEIAAGFERYMRELGRIHGFGVPGVDYEAPVEMDPDLFALPNTYNLNSVPQASLRPVIPSGEEGGTSPVSETRLGPAEAFLQSLLSDSRRQVTYPEEGKKGTVYYVHKAKLDPVRVSHYARTTRQKDDGTMPAAYTFVHATPAIFAAIGDEIEKRIAEGRSVAVVHGSENPALSEVVPSNADLESRAWVTKKIERDGLTTFIVDRETLRDDRRVGTGRTLLVIGADPQSLPVTYADPSVLEGTNLGTVTLNQSWVNDYAGITGDNNLPHSPEGAAALGWEKPIAHGMLTLGLANRRNALGYKAAFKGPVVVGESVTFYEGLKGKITGVKPGPEGRWINVIELSPI